VYAAFPVSFSLLSFTAESKKTIALPVFDGDGDGDLDYVAANSDSTDIQKNNLYSNNGSAVFTPGADFGLSHTAKAMRAGDIDGDGDIDLIGLRTPFTVTTLTKYLNDGSGNFAASDFFTGGFVTLMNIALTDMDNDGDLDVIGCPVSGYGLSAFRNDGTGAFTQVASQLPACTHITAADFNSDGFTDIATLNFNSSVLVHLNSGTGAFTQSTALVGSYDHSLNTADLDGDGDIDIVASLIAFGQVITYLNDGTGTSFALGQTFGTVAEARSAGLADLDNDGDVDVLLGGGDIGALNAGNEVWINNGSGIFSQTGTPTEESDCTIAVALADIDADTDLDYIAGNDNSNCTGVGGVNRHYVNSIAFSTPNDTPVAPATLLSTISASHSTGSTAPKTPLMATDVAGVGTMPWLHPENIYTLNSVSSSGGMMDMTNHTTHWLKATDFGFNIPSGSTIVGIVTSWHKNYGGCGMWDNGSARNQKSIVGHFKMAYGTTTVATGSAHVYNSSQIYFESAYVNSSAGASAGPWGSSFLSFTAAESISALITVPCQGRSSNVSAAKADQTNYGWTSYTPTFTGFGTVTISSANDCKHKRDGEDLLIDCKFTTGTHTATEARMSLPGSLTSAAFPSIKSAGGHVVARSETTAASVLPLIEPSVTYLTFGNLSGSTASLTKVNGNALASSNTYSLFARVPISGWTENQKAPVLVGSVTSAATSALRVEFVSFGGSTVLNSACTTTPCTIWNQSGGISSVTRTSAGQYVVNFASGTWSVVPTCVYTGFLTDHKVNTSATLTAVGVSSRDSSFTFADGQTNQVICFGPR
jgi:hypothetical protein